MRREHLSVHPIAAALLGAALLTPPAGAADHLELHVAIDPAREHVEVVATYRIPAAEATQPLAFYLSKQLELRSVEGEQLASHAIEPGDSFLDQQGQRLVVAFPEGAQGDLEFRLEYAGALPEAFEGDWMEFFVDRFWFPVHESLRRQLTAELHISLPEGYTVFGRGDVQRTDEGWHIAVTRPVTDLNWVASTALEVQTFDEDEEQVLVAGVDLDRDASAQIAGQITWLLRWYNAAFGEAAPEHRVALVLRPHEGLPGYARPGYIALHVGDDLKDAAPNYFQLFAHEVSHLWWSKGSPVGFENWLNESFAEYASLLALRAHGDQAAFEQALSTKRAGTPGLPPVIGMERTDPAAHAVFYTKGCVLLHDLEQKIGDAAFMAWLELLVSREASTTDDALLLLEEAQGGDVAAWFADKLST